MQKTMLVLLSWLWLSVFVTTCRLHGWHGWIEDMTHVKAYISAEDQKFPDYTEGDDPNFEKLEKDFFPSGFYFFNSYISDFA